MRNWIAGVAALIALPLLLMLAIFATPFLLVGALTPRVARRIESETTPWQNIIEYYPEIGWKPRPNLVAVAADNNGDPFRVRTGPDGWRGRGSIENADVVVFGDSFAFGCGVDDEAHFAAIHEDVRIKAIGAPGYNMVQSLLWMQRFAPVLRGKLVAWLILHGNDLEDNLSPEMERYRTPFVRETEDGGWRIVTEHVSPEPWPFPMRATNAENFIEICRPSFLATRAYGACEFLIEGARAICREAGAELVVLTIPELSPMQTKKFAKLVAKGGIKDFDPSLPDRRIGEVCERLGIRFVALADHLTAADYLEKDVHWNASGNFKVANVLRDLYLDFGSPGAEARTTSADARADAVAGARVANRRTGEHAPRKHVKA